MTPFVFESRPARVVFGRGALAQAADELDRLGVRRALVLCTPQQQGQAQTVSDLIGARAAGVFPHAAMHVPVETARAAQTEARRLGVDGAVAFGGGSTIGLAKAIALESGLPILAIPTTYAGSEMTPIYGLTENGVKKTGRDPKVLPRTVIYDPELTLGLPVPMSIVSGINAMAHAAEGLYARDGNPVTSLMAEEGLRALATALPALRRAPGDLEARSQALYGAWLCGSVLGQVGMALHHKLCHTLGGSFNLPHAEVHAVVLAHAIGFNACAAPQAMRRIARALGVADGGSAAGALYDLACGVGAPLSLKEIGMAQADLDRAADLVFANPYWNPRPLGIEERPLIRKLLQDAYDGRRPG